MLAFIISLVFAALALIFRALYKTYEHIPAKELKRQARSGDPVAGLLYRPVAYGINLKVLLSTLLLVTAGLSLIFMINAVGTWLAVVVLLVITTIGVVAVVPGAELTNRSVWLAEKAAPALSWLLERTQPLIGWFTRFARKHRPVRLHTGLYEKSDLAELLKRQKGQADSRISSGEIDMLVHALSFGDELVADALVPKRVVKLVASSESVGPILMADLHKSGHSRFPVYEEKHDNIVGILYMHDLVTAKHSGTVAELMKQKLTYVHEDFTLYQTLQAFLKTKQHLFLVVNSFEEYVGIITIEDVIEKMIGRSIIDEFDRYDDLRAVAAAAAKKDHKARNEPKADTDEPIEITNADDAKIEQ